MTDTKWQPMETAPVNGAVGIFFTTALVGVLAEISRKLGDLPR